MNEVVCDFTKENMQHLLSQSIEISSVPISKDIVFLLDVPSSIDSIYHSIVGVTNHLLYKTQETTAQLFNKLQHFFSIPYPPIQAWEKAAAHVKNLVPYAINELLYFPITADCPNHLHWIAYHQMTAQWKNAANQLVLHCENCADIVLPYTYRIATHHCNQYKALIQKNVAIWSFLVEISQRTTSVRGQHPAVATMASSECFKEYLYSQASYILQKAKKRLPFELNPEDEEAFRETVIDAFAAAPLLR